MASQKSNTTKLVTALFSNHEGFPIFGQNRTRSERYLHSLASIARTGEKIVCYLEEEYLEEYRDFWNTYGREKGYYDIDDFTNIEFVFITLDQFKHSQRMFDLKQKYSTDDDYKMFHEIDWMKLQLLEQEIDDQHDYFYWIDCGLSHAGLFPCSASEKPDQEGLADFRHYSCNWPMYDFGRIFNPDLFFKVWISFHSNFTHVHTFHFFFWSNSYANCKFNNIPYNSGSYNCESPYCKYTI